MIVVKLKGGIGNQMFQYEADKSVALRNNVKLKLDKDWFDNIKEKDTYRVYSLDVFNLKENYATFYDINRLKFKDVLDKSFSYLKLKKRNYFYLQEIKDSFDKRVLTQKDCCIDGYWQTYKYFGEIKETLEKKFIIKDRLNAKSYNLFKKIKNNNSVAIHIRRGEYVKNEDLRKKFHVCDIDYYKRTMKKINSIIDNPKFYIFSNDINWAKKNIKFYDDIEIVDFNNPAYVDMHLMKNCKHIIIANSSFSWWAAYLNDYNNKIVISPQKWFNLENRDGSNKIPERWIKI